MIPTGGTGRYLAYIRVESCMRPLSGLPAIDRDLSANQALAALASLKQPEALVTVDGEPAGVVTVQDLIAADAGVPVIAVAGKSPVLSPGDSLSRAIALLRERDRHYALVRDDTGAKGLFFIVDALGRPGGREQP